ncbi:30S ribosomal protein S3 [Candidatus Woesearchaeota archaeon]|nr:30S ribosomal protein S3 [Candidatus Woesearchaeota archaeon]
MIERKFVTEKIKEFQIQEYVKSGLKNAGLSHVKVQKTPLGEKVVVYSSRPGLVVGRKGQNIKLLTKTLKKRFELENPQIEISEVENRGLNASIMAENIASYLERFGTKNFKGIGHKVMTEVMGSGALGIEIILSGKIPSSRAKNWRFYSGYLRKCGDISIEGVHKAYAVAQLKSGIVGIKISIMPPDIKLPDNIDVLDEKEERIEETEEDAESAKEEGKTKKKKESQKEKKEEPKENKKKKGEKKDEDKGTKVNG